MGFIIDSTIINIKLTDVGRQLLSRGELTFDQFAVGDSEVDYEFYNDINFDPSNATILRPKDDNPNIVSYITRDVNGSEFSSLPTIVSNTSVITNTAPTRGFFRETGSDFVIENDSNLIKQPDLAIALSGLTGNKTVLINQSINYGSNPTEPVAGDLLLVRWGNPDYGDSVGFTVDDAIPYLWYKIERIISGSIAGDNLVVELDRPTPNFSGAGGSAFAGAYLYPNSNNRLVSGDSIQTYYGSSSISDFVSEAVLSFIENYDAPTIDVPIWNMHVVMTKEIEGIQLTGRSISDYYSRVYGGFVQYVQRISPEVERIGIIHYTNNSPSNNYGEGLVQNTMTLDLPTIMWHKSTGATIGLTLTSDTSVLTLTGLNTTYQDLLDPSGNIVGKVFLDLKMFVIEDQELLYAMSYKSNRSWTLGQPNVGFNVFDCP